MSIISELRNIGDTIKCVIDQIAAFGSVDNGCSHAVIDAESRTICAGSSYVSLVATGLVEGDTIQWQLQTDGVWNNLSGAISETYESEPLDGGTYYFRGLINDGQDCEYTTNILPLVVHTSIAEAYDNADDNEICDGGTTTLHSEVIYGGGDYGYQWQEFIEGVWVDIPGANSADYTTPELSGSGVGETFYRYRLQVNDGGCLIYTDGEDIYVNSDPTINLFVDDDLFCDGGNTTLHSEVLNGAGQSNYQWQLLLNDVWTNIVNANGQDYTTDTDTDGNYVGSLSEGVYEYRLVVTQDSGCETTSDSIIITVIAKPEATASTETPDVCVDGQFVITSEVTGGDGLSFYQWQKKVGSDWVDIFGANSADYTNEESLPGETTQEYRVQVFQDAGCSADSNSVFINVAADPDVFVLADDESLCTNGTAHIASEVLGGAGGNNYQWQIFNDPDWEDIFGENGPEFTSGSLADGEYRYRLVVTQNLGCATTSAEVVITVDAGNC